MKSSMKAFVSPYSHIDYAWRNTRKYFLMKNAHILFAVVDYMKNERDYVWGGLHKAHILMGIIKRYPWLVEELKTFILEGRIDLGGAMVSTPQPHLYEGEALINNAVYGRKYFEKVLGAETLSKAENQVLHMADPVGHHAQMPQITKKLGFRYYKFERPWEVYDAKDVPLEFYWEGLDGTRVLCSRSVYGNFAKVGRFLGGHGSVHTDYQAASSQLKELLGSLAKYSKTGFILLMDGSDWSMPSLGLMEFVRRWNEKEAVKLTVGTLTKYFQELEKTENIPVLRGTLDPMGFVARYGFRSPIPHMITEASNSLITAEKTAFIAHLLKKPYPEQDLTHRWTTLSVWECHGNVSQFDEDYEEEVKTIGEIDLNAKETTQENLRWFAKHVEIRGKGTPILAFNPLAWRRNDLLEVRVEFKEAVEGFSVIDYRGKPVPYQVLEAEREDGKHKRARMLIATDAPPLGYKTLYVTQANTTETNTSLKYRNNTLENKFCRIRLKNGKITSIYDKANQREVVAPSQCSANEIVCERGDVRLLIGRFDQVHRSEKGVVTLVERGPVRMKVKVESQVAGNPIEQFIIIYDDNPRIDFETIIHCRVKEARFKTVFPLNIRGGRLYCDIPFGAEERNLDNELLLGIERSHGWEGARGVTYGLNWSEVTNGEYGAALLNKGDNGYGYGGNALSLILHLSTEPEKMEHYRVCNITGLGAYSFQYSLYPHHGDWREGGVCRRAFEYKHPLVGVQVTRGEGKLPQEKGFLEIEPTNLILTSLRIEDGETNMRFYEAHGKATTAKIKAGFTVNDPRKTDFLGKGTQSIEGGKDQKIRTGPYEIVNLRAEFNHLDY